MPSLSPDAGVLHLRLRNQFASLELARLAVHEFIAPLSLSDKVLFSIELVLEECLANIVLHAFTDDAAHEIEFSVWMEADTLALRFEDDGRYFDPHSAQDPAVPHSIAEASPGGLGLMLVRKRARSVDYVRQGDRNTLTVHVSIH